ncbi:MAG: lysophospholipid acyltransferase family protein [Ekhidna sp.]
MAKKNVFGQSLWLKKKVFQIMGRVTRSWLLETNNLNISGAEVLTELPENRVLFIANHQTIFTDVIAMFHVFFSTLNGQVNTIEKNNYLKDPKLNLYFVAARETMEKGFLPKIFALAGAVTVDRTWRQGEAMIQREVNPDDTKSIGMAIEDGWVVTFPQGTTREGAPVRKGTAHIIKQYEPIVVPVRVDGFRKAFDKTGLKKLEKGVDLSLKFGQPLKIDYENVSVEALVKHIGVAIDEDN